MADDDRMKALEGRIAELENLLARQTKTPMESLTAEEMQTFTKVRDVIAADWGEFCGINDCFRCRVCRTCVVCRVCRVCRVCDHECICGPCVVDGPIGRGVAGFSDFGG